MQCHVCKIVFPILLIFALLLYAGSRFLPPLAPDHFTIATGLPGGIYYESAQKYKALLAKQRVRVEIIPTNGSVESLKLLQEGKADVAFVQGGSADEYKSEPFASLASLYNEPIWIYYPASGPELHYLSELKGKRIAVGVEGSGTRALALKLLKANGIDVNNTTLLPLGNEAGAQALFDREADALFSIIGTFAPLTKALLLDSGIKLMTFSRTKAYSVRYPYLNPIQLDEGVLDLEHNLPPKTKKLIAATATLVAKDDIHPDLVRLILQATKKVHGDAGIFRKAGEFPSAQRLEFPINVDAEVYLRDGDSWLERIFPFWIASILKRAMLLLIPVIALMIPLIKLILPLFDWRSRSRIYKWYKVLHKIDEEMDDYDDDAREKAAALLRKQLEKIKKVNVPLSYRREYYDLQQHFELVLGKLRSSV